MYDSAVASRRGVRHANMKDALRIQGRGIAMNPDGMTTGPKPLDGMCESCLMPFKKDPRGADREHARYCSYCYSDGKLCYEGDDLAGFKQAMVDAIVARGESRLKAKVFAFMAGFAPRWRQ